MKKFICLLAVLMSSFTVSHAADMKAGVNPVTQLDFAARLIDNFGWSEGLPDKPSERDYLAVLNGKRSFKFEAEDIFDQKTDPLSVRDYNIFGDFTGRGWIHGMPVPSAVHFSVFLPLSGKYTVTAAAKGFEQLWSVAGRAFKVNATQRLKDLLIGQVLIPPGRLEFNAVIPPDGGIDYILFTAPSLAPIEPVSGWNFTAPITRGQLAEVRGALIGNEHLLPDDKLYKARLISPAALNSLPPGVQITESQVHGKPLSQKWVRAGQAPVTLNIPFEAEKPGVYRVRVRYFGAPLMAGFGSRGVTVESKPYLEWVDLGAFRLTKSEHVLQLHLPSSGGVDQVEITRKLSSVTDYLALAGLAGNPDENILPDDLDGIMKSLQEAFKERR